MSNALIPATPIILSKLKYLIQSRYKDDPELENVMKKLGPFYNFKISATFRSLTNGQIINYDDMEVYLDRTDLIWDDIEVAKFAFVNARNYLHEKIRNPGILRVAIVHQPEIPLNGHETEWWDLFVDEIPINVRGIRDENGEEITFYKKENAPK